MKILAVNPFGGTEPGAKETFAKIARPDVQFEVENIKPVFPLDYNTWGYNMLKVTNATVERIIKAEEEGYDAVFISCMQDPGLYESRAVVDIPVTASLESAAWIAMMMGKKFSIVTVPPPVPQQMSFIVDKYGLRERTASIRYIDIIANKLYPEQTDPEVVKEMTMKVIRKCVEEDGAEVIISGCTILGAVLTTFFDASIKDEPVPIIDPMVAGFKMTELMVDLMKLGYPAVSRLGLWKKQPEQEHKDLREWMRKNPSPEQYYQGLQKEVR